MTLGASDVAVIRMVVRQMLLLTTAGIAIGLAGSWAATDVLASLLFNVTPTDTVTFAVAVGVLVVAAVAAAFVPARRAARLDPVTVLRAE